MKRLIGSNQGFALADILVSMLVMALLAGGIITMLVATSRTYVASSDQQDSQQNARLVVAYLAKQIAASPLNDNGQPENISLENNLLSYDASHPTTGSNQIAVFDPSTSKFVQGYWDYDNKTFIPQDKTKVSLIRFSFNPKTRTLYRDDFSNLTGATKLSSLTGDPVASNIVATDLDNVVFTNVAVGSTGSGVHIYVAARPYNKPTRDVTVYETTVMFH